MRTVPHQVAVSTDYDVSTRDLTISVRYGGAPFTAEEFVLLNPVYHRRLISGAPPELESPALDNPALRSVIGLVLSRDVMRAMARTASPPDPALARAPSSKSLTRLGLPRLLLRCAWTAAAQ